MASVITQTLHKRIIGKDKYRVIKFACTAHTDGSFDAVTTTTLNNKFMGWGLYKFQVEVGGTPPTASSDFTLTDSNGIDLLGGSGTDKITTSDTEGYPVIGTQPVVQPVVTPLTLTITNNSENGATFNIYLYFKNTV